MMSVFEQFSSAKNLYQRYIWPVCRQFGLTQMEFHILLFLANNPEYDTAAQVVKYRNLATSHVSVSVKALQEKGLLEGYYLPGDRKSVHLRLCAASEPVVLAGKQAQGAFGKQLVQGFSEEEVEQLGTFIQRIQNNMKAGE